MTNIIYRMKRIFESEDKALENLIKHLIRCLWQEITLISCHIFIEYSFHILIIEIASVNNAD